MFRIRESYPERKTVCIWVDGRLSDGDLGHFQDILEKYLNSNQRVLVNLTHLNHIGWRGKKLLQEIGNRVELVDLPEYLKAEILNVDIRDPEK